MARENEEYIKAAPNSVVICVDDVAGRRMKGSYIQMNGDVERAFSSFDEFLLDLDIFMDQNAAPQSYTEHRTWDMPRNKKQRRRPKRPKEECATRRIKGRGKVATFVLYVYVRRNTSWQGEVIWLEANKTVVFRSVLELLHLLWTACDNATYRKFGVMESDFWDDGD